MSRKIVKGNSFQRAAVKWEGEETTGVVVLMPLKDRGKELEVPTRSISVIETAPNQLFPAGEFLSLSPTARLEKIREYQQERQAAFQKPKRKKGPSDPTKRVYKKKKTPLTKEEQESVNLVAGLTNEQLRKILEAGGKL